MRFSLRRQKNRFSKLHGPASAPFMVLSGFAGRRFWRHHYERRGGFTIIELMVSVAIMTVITTLVLVSHSRFSGNILLGNLVYDIALSVRQAQVYGLSVREFAVSSGEFNLGYGVHFDSAANDTYILFADRNRNNTYDDQSEVIEIFTLRRGNYISTFCAVTPGPSYAEKCSPTDIDILNIVFQRPNPDARITTDIAEPYISARITVSAVQGKQRDIFVANTGQISIANE